MHNWVEQYDLVCASGEQIGLIGSLFFAGWCSTLLIVPIFADKYGRKWIYFGCIQIVFACMIGTVFNTKLKWLYVLMFFAGAATTGRTTIGYIYGNEFLTPKWQVVFGTVFMMEDGGVYLILSFFFGFISD